MSVLHEPACEADLPNINILWLNIPWNDRDFVPKKKNISICYLSSSIKRYIYGNIIDSLRR